ncbi:MAG: low-specificity L-threonine aldolase, partial [Pseudomonas sp.]
DAAADGTLPLDVVASVIKPDDVHFARTKLLCIENTHNGKVLPLDYLQQAWVFTREKGLALHVDGARIMNAAVSLNVPLSTLTQYCDTLTICLSKGLGAPIGSLLCGSAEYIKQARRWRKMVGGGMRQAGILAEAARYALLNNVERLREDHDNAQWLANALSAIGVEVMAPGAQTNMLFLKVPAHEAAQLGGWMKERGVLMSAGPVTRIVTHLDVSRSDLEKLVSLWKEFKQSINTQ